MNEHPIAQCASHAAEILDPRLTADQARLTVLMRDPATLGFDAFEQQAQDLLQTRHAGLADANELARAMREFRHNDPLHAGVWVYYPWSRRLVHLLAEPHFIELRTNRNQHKITACEQARLATKKIGVIGLSVGNAAALALAQERVCGELRLADFDHIDLSNLNRLRCAVHEIGCSKASVTARQIAELDPFLPVHLYPAGVTAENVDAFLDGLDLLVEECDSLDIKVLVREAARRRRIPVVMNASDRGLTDVERFDTEPARPLLHGLLPGLSSAGLCGLSTQEKVPMILTLTAANQSTPRLRASMFEINRSISTWPQLASDVHLGGGIICDVSRRILLDEAIASGRYRLDLETCWQHPIELPHPTIPPSQSSIDTDHHEKLPVVTTDGVRLPLGSLINDAGLAPSAGNLQPWRWEWNGTALLLRSACEFGSASDPFGATIYAALGASLENLIRSAQHHGFMAHVTELPSADAVAVIRFTQVERVDIASETAYAALRERFTYRDLPSRKIELEESQREALESELSTVEGARCLWLHEQPALNSLARLAGDAMRLRLLNPDMHAELLKEIDWSENAEHSKSRGIALNELRDDPTLRAALQMLRDRRVLDLLDQWDQGHGLGKMAEEEIQTASAVGLLLMPQNRPVDRLHAGIAMQRLWCRCARLGLGFQPCPGMVYQFHRWRAGVPLTARESILLPEMRAEFERLFHGQTEGAAEHLLFRIVHDDARRIDRPSRPHRRQSVREVLTISGVEATVAAYENAAKG